MASQHMDFCTGMDESETFHERRLRRLTLVAVHQILISEPLSARLCDACRDRSEGLHSEGCQAPLRSWDESREKAELWSQAYCFYGYNWGSVHWSDLEILRPRIVETLLRYNWSANTVEVSVVDAWCLNCVCVCFYNGRMPRLSFFDNTKLRRSL